MCIAIGSLVFTVLYIYIAFYEQSKSVSFAWMKKCKLSVQVLSVLAHGLIESEENFLKLLLY